MEVLLPDRLADYCNRISIRREILIRQKASAENGLHAHNIKIIARYQFAPDDCCALAVVSPTSLAKTYAAWSFSPRAQVGKRLVLIAHVSIVGIRKVSPHTRILLAAPERSH